MKLLFTTVNLLVSLIGLYLTYRNYKVSKIRIRLIKENFDNYDYLPTYNSMLYSFKPLTYKYWLAYVERVKSKNK